MKQLTVVLALLLLMAAPAYAGNGFISWQGNIMNWEDDNIKETPMLNAVEAGYSWEHAEASIEGAYVKAESNFGSTFDVTTVMAVGKLKYPINKFTPYIVGGIGHAWFQNKKFAAIPSPHRCKRYRKYETLANKDSIAWKSGAGLQYAFTDHISAFVEGAYRYTDTGEPSNLDTYGWSYGGGVKVYF